MPCGDISERIVIKLDSESRLNTYSFSKKTCGGVIGSESLILDLLGGKKAEDIIKLSEPELLKSTKFADKNEEFITLKHLFGVKIALEVYLGESTGSVGELCALAGIEYSSDNETIIDVDINLNLVTSRIESCGDCGLKTIAKQII